MLKNKLFAGAIFALALFVAGSVSAAYTFPNQIDTLQEKKDVQTVLNMAVTPSPALTVDGVLGAKSIAAVKAFQAMKGLTVDGKIGPMTRAALEAASAGTTTTTVAGCPAGALFNTVTGAPCTTVTTTVPGCVAGAAFSSTTGASCAGTTTVVTTTGAAGNADVTSTTSEVETTVSEGATSVKVLGFKVAATDSDILVRNVKVTLENKSATSSKRIERYMGNVDIYMGSVKVATAAASDFTKEGSVYTKNFALNNAVVKEGASNKATFWVALSSVNNIDSTDVANDLWNVNVSDIRYSDGTGIVLTSSYNTATAATTKVPDFQSLSTSGDVKLNISKGSASPAAGNVKVSDTGTTGSILMNQFKLKATGTSMTVSKVSVIATSSTMLANSLSELTLKVGDQTATNVEAITTGSSSQTLTFTLDTDVVIAQDATVTFDVLAKTNKIGTTAFPQGTTLKVSYVSATIEDKLGDPVTSNISGSSLGENQTFFSAGVNASNFVSSVLTTTNTNGTTTKQTYTVSFSLTAFGNTYYIPKTVVRGALGTTDGLAYTMENSDGSTASTSAITSTASSMTSTASTEGSAYLLADGETKTFTATVEVTSAGNAVGFYHVQLGSVGYSLNNPVTAVSTYTFAPAQNYEAADRSI